MVNIKSKSKKEYDQKSRFSKRATANKARSLQREALIQTIEELKSVARTSPLVSANAMAEKSCTNTWVKALGIYLEEFPETFCGVVNKNFEQLVEMQCNFKSLERLLFYLNFYRQPADAVTALRETAQLLVQRGRRKIRVFAFRTTVLEQNIDSEFLENPSFKRPVFLLLILLKFLT